MSLASVDRRKLNSIGDGLAGVASGRNKASFNGAIPNDQPIDLIFYRLAAVPDYCDEAHVIGYARLDKPRQERRI